MVTYQGITGIISLMPTLGRIFVWMCLLIFVATVSCALACAPLEVRHKASATSSGCCAASADSHCFECVDASFVKENKCLDALVATASPEYNQIEPSDITSQSVPIQTVILAETVFLKNGVFRI